MKIKSERRAQRRITGLYLLLRRQTAAFARLCIPENMSKMSGDVTPALLNTGTITKIEGITGWFDRESIAECLK
jgi:hypothetical protein